MSKLTYRFDSVKFMTHASTQCSYRMVQYDFSWCCGMCTLSGEHTAHYNDGNAYAHITTLLFIAKYCIEYVCVRVCLSVCLSARISPEIHVRSLSTFCACCLWSWLGHPPASIRYIRYVLPVCGWHHVFFYNGPYSGMNFATNDQFRLNLLLYHKVEQNSISFIKGIILTISKLLENYSKRRIEKFND